MTVSSTVSAVLAGLALVAALAGCGEAAPPAAPPASSAPAAAGSGGPPVSAAPAARVSANNASEEELVTAFEQAGIDNADRWAEEVVEYRPYPADDPNFATLRGELAKYNPGQATVDQIVATLTP